MTKVDAWPFGVQVNNHAAIQPAALLALHRRTLAHPLFLFLLARITNIVYYEDLSPSSFW
jgi:hypothetical protein